MNYLEIRGGAVASYNVKIALGEFPVAATLGVFAPPDLGNMVTLEWKAKLLPVLCEETGKGNSEVKAKGYIPVAVILKTVYLFFRFPSALAE